MTPPIALLEDVDFAYRREQLVLDGVTLVVEPSTVTAITGPSGSGKSTALYLLGALLRPTAGRVVLKGRDISKASDAARARARSGAIGFLFQDGLLDTSMSVFENVLEGIRFAPDGVTGTARADARRLLDEFGLSSLASRRASGLSGGQGQRVALCRALLKAPALLLADEPTGNLDDQTASVVINALLTHARRADKAVVIVTHDERVAAKCDRIVRIRGLE